MDRTDVSDEQERGITSDFREVHGWVARGREVPERFAVFASVD